MQLGRLLFIVIMSGGLLACASTRLSQELQAGKISFEGGYYKQAFHQLLPIAVQGRSEAQYAVGYMYYYGYGVALDEDTGIFWMRKAAEKHYAPAMTALETLRQQAVETSSERVDGHAIRSQVSLLEMEHAKPKPASDLMLHASPQHHYTLQLFGSRDLASVKMLQAQLKLKHTSYVYHTTHTGKDWYVLTFGHFATAKEAVATTQNLPPELKQLAPWARATDLLHRQV